MIQLFYFFYFQAIGIYMPFVPAYFRAHGLSGREISTIFAMQPLLSVVVPLGWSWLADRSGRHDRVLRLVIGGAWLGLTPLLFADHFLAILGSWACYAVFGVGVGGLADALAIARVRAGAVYGRLRLWGSVGFVTAALAVGGAVELLEAGRPGRLVPFAMWLSLASAFAAALRLKGAGEAHAKPHAADLHALMKDRRLLLLLLIGVLHWMCLAPYNVFFGVFLHDLGLRPISWGLAYSTGVVAEIAVMLVFHRLQARFSLAALLAASFAASALRWLAIGTISNPAALIALQLLHGMTFGMFWSAAIALAAAVVPAPLRATGQALLVMAINLCGAFGNALTGRLYDASGSRTMFLLAAAGELAPLLLVLRGRARLRT
jgi:PPP family 3-phenylpropionic acid transporter